MLSVLIMIKVVKQVWFGVKERKKVGILPMLFVVSK